MDDYAKRRASIEEQVAARDPGESGEQVWLAVHESYTEGITDKEWVEATLSRLRGRRK
jgi:hypothetical protein